MTANINIAGAAPTQLKWQGLNWPKHCAVVKKLQVRIAKAVQENRYGKVKALQRLLTTSLSAKVLAVKKVTQNKGRNTPGVDGIIIKSPGEKSALVRQLKRRDYKPKPLRRVYIKKKDGKKLRPLSIPTILDRCQQQLYYFSVNPVSETISDANSYGFRPERNCADAIEQCFIVLSQKHSSRWILEGDIKGCFDNISHEWMLKNICMDKSILKKWLEAGYIETNKLFPTSSGTPQGGIISPCLSNFVLDGIEQLLDNVFGSRRPGINVVRYADDFIITASTKEILEEKIKPLLVKFLHERGLELSSEKTKITPINEGFDFLGQNIRKYPSGKGREKLLIKPSKESVKTFLKKVRTIISKSGSMNQLSLIGILNPIILGWANYHRSIVAKATFDKVDHEIWLKLWRWAKRRHSKKGSKWVLRKYFTTKDLRRYRFSVKDKSKKAIVERSLIKTSDTSIIRHIKIRSEANVFSKQYDEYFEVKRSAKLMNSKTGIKMVISLFKKQGNRCVCCGELITMRHKWIVHLLTSRLNGGDYNIKNLSIIHYKCHRMGFKTKFVYKLPVTLNKSDLIIA
ncbi:group II intron reverse transcriptase/maturase [Pedobacter sp. L105]|uniref:group II intron reverse transcriptase/maturase n=1 Tax=Pedobacter sp. L105 TaxID=1641871 RepID=UPI00131DDCA9|nr:group II intron reverse transcriptase/maturase [Pedobacter sp. L105]